MTNAECVEFLQWALPQLDMRWAGFRKVRRQVCRRIGRRLDALGLSNAAAYRAHLERHPAEWQVVDDACRITISRFYRDRGVFKALSNVVVPELARAVLERGEHMMRCLSVGCASGEEPYSIKLLWELELAQKYESLTLSVTGIDSHPVMLERARRACYHAGSFKDLPETWWCHAFERTNGEYCLRRQFRQGVRFIDGDVRRSLPPGPFDLVLCRNLVFTYFEDCLQCDILRELHARMHDDAALVVGIHESLPDDCVGFRSWDSTRCIYRRTQAGQYRVPAGRSGSAPSPPRRTPSSHAGR